MRFSARRSRFRSFLFTPPPLSPGQYTPGSGVGRAAGRHPALLGLEPQGVVDAVDLGALTLQESGAGRLGEGLAVGLPQIEDVGDRPADDVLQGLAPLVLLDGVFDRDRREDVDR